MQPYDLEIGPIQMTFDNLFKSIGHYFQSNPVVPEGKISETSFSTYKQEHLRSTLNSSLVYYGFSDLPQSLQVVVSEDSEIGGFHRSDEISTYDEKLKDGSHRTFNFYSTFGPENMKVSYYWLDMSKGGEQTQGILTSEGIWYFRITTSKEDIFYQRMEKAKQNW